MSGWGGGERWRDEVICLWREKMVFIRCVLELEGWEGSFHNDGYRPRHVCPKT